MSAVAGFPESLPARFVRGERKTTWQQEPSNGSTPPRASASSPPRLAAKISLSTKSEIQVQGYRELTEGQRVEFDVTKGQKGMQASVVKPLG